MGHIWNDDFVRRSFSHPTVSRMKEGGGEGGRGGGVEEENEGFCENEGAG
jgi:hypothetical protein